MRVCGSGRRRQAARTSGAKGNAAGSQGGRVWRSMALLPTSGRATASDGCHSRLSRSGAPSASRPPASPAHAPGSGLRSLPLHMFLKPPGNRCRQAHCKSERLPQSQAPGERHHQAHCRPAQLSWQLRPRQAGLPGNTAHMHVQSACGILHNSVPASNAAFLPASCPASTTRPSANHDRCVRALGHAASGALPARTSRAALPTRLLATSAGRPSAAAASGGALSPGAPAAVRASSCASASSAAGAAGR